MLAGMPLILVSGNPIMFVAGWILTLIWEVVT